MNLFSISFAIFAKGAEPMAMAMAMDAIAGCPNLTNGSKLLTRILGGQERLPILTACRPSSWCYEHLRLGSTFLKRIIIMGFRALQVLV